jgi:hypothetical protein
MTDDQLVTMLEARMFRHSSFALPSSFVIRHSSFTGLAEALRPAQGVDLVETASPSKARR